MKRRVYQERPLDLGETGQAGGPLATALIDRELRFVAVDDGIAALNGRAAGEHLGRHVGEMLPLLAPAIEPLLRHVLATGEPLHDIELRGEAAQGRLGRWLISYEPVRARGGTVLAVECFVRELAADEPGLSLATAHAALHEAATQLAFQARILEQLNDAVIAVQPEGTISYWGPGAERLFGLTSSAATGRHVIELLLPEGIDDATSSEARETLAAGELWRAEVELRGSSGPISTEISARALVDVVGATMSYLIVVRDNTAHRRAELERDELIARERRALEALEAAARAAREEQSLLDTLIGSAPIGFDFVDRELRFVRINEALAANNGLTVAEHLGRTVREVLPELADSVEPLLRHVLATGEPLLDLEVHGETKAQPGVPRIWRESLYPVRSADGEVLGVGAIVTEITEYRRISDERGQLLIAARAAAERTASLQAITAALAPVLTPAEVAQEIVDEAVRVLRARSGVLALLDGSGATLHAAYYTGYPPSRLADTRWPLSSGQPLTEAVRLGKPIFVRDLAEAERLYPHMAHARAGIPDVAWANLPLITEGRVAGALSLGFTTPQAFGPEDQAMLIALAQQCAQALERTRLYEAERRAREEAESAVRDRDELIALISHDLKNPLTVIQGQAQLLERRVARGGAELGSLVRGLAAIHQAAVNMNAQIEELLDVALIRAGRPLQLHPQPVDLVELARRCMAMAQANTNRHTLSLTAEQPALTGLWDELRVERVVGNLLSNALKYSPNGGTISVTVRRQEGDGGAWAALSVADSGMGIPAADLPRVFEGFHRAANTAGQIKGTGLGLTSARRIVEQHGGTIDVASIEGAGSVFTVRLPL